MTQDYNAFVGISPATDLAYRTSKELKLSFDEMLQYFGKEVFDLRTQRNELLEALKYFTINLRKGIETSFPPHLKFMLDEFYSKADAAVAKAKGEPNV